MAADGAGGAFIAWNDVRAGFGAEDVYAQHLDATGTRLWALNGVGAATQEYDEFEPELLPDGSGGVFVSYVVNISVNPLWVQRLDALGQALDLTDPVAVEAGGAPQVERDLVVS